MAKVSVIVPVYNVEKYLRQCLDSLVNQTLTDIEIICINDGSTDGSLAILEDYASKDKRIRLISQENQGQGVARNRGIELSTGEYLGFVDPDDWIELNMYEEMYSKAKLSDAMIVEAMYSEFFESSGKTKIRKSPVTLPENQVFTWKIHKDYLFKSSILAVWNKIYKKTFVNQHKIRFAEAKLAEDHIFTLKSKVLAEKINFINKPYYNYRVHRDSAVNSISPETLRVIDILKDVNAFFNEQGVRNKYNCKEFDSYFEFTLARQYASVPEGCKSLYEQKCRAFLTDKQYKEYQKFKFGKFKPLERIFSLKNETCFGVRYKVLVLLGCKIKFKPV